MKKRKTRKEWIKLFKIYETKKWSWEKYYQIVNFSDKYMKKQSDRSVIATKKANARSCFKIKYKEWKMLDNLFMKKRVKKRITKNKKIKPKRDFNKIYDSLTDKERRDVVKRYWEIQEEEKTKSKKKQESKKFNWRVSKKADFFDLDRTSFYKIPKPRVYKFDFATQIIIDKFYENQGIYGSRRLSVVLANEGINISDRTLRNYLKRLGLKTRTRVAKRRAEVKNTTIKYPDLVKRDYNPVVDSVLATDVSYISSNEPQNNVYLSIVINHKTKLIESFAISKDNNTKLVIDTIKKVKRKNFIFHSDHGVQYSTSEVKNLLHSLNAKSSMGRVGNCLDNREAEYFFSCLKGEYLNHIPTYKMKIDEIRKHITWYINWYNNNRIQKRLQWKTPVQTSIYAA